MKLEAALAEIEGDLCAMFRVTRHPDGSFIVATPFAFPDGDGFTVNIREGSAGTLEISDRRQTFAHIDESWNWTEPRIARLNTLVGVAGAQFVDGEITMSTGHDGYPISADVVEFIRLIAHVESLPMQEQDAAELEIRFKTAVRGTAAKLAREELHANWHAPRDETRLFPADFAFLHRPDQPVVGFAVSTTLAANRAASFVQHYRNSWDMMVEPIVLAERVSNRELNRLGAIIGSEHVHNYEARDDGVMELALERAGVPTG